PARSPVRGWERTRDRCARLAAALRRAVAGRVAAGPAVPGVDRVVAAVGRDRIGPRAWGLVGDRDGRPRAGLCPRRLRALFLRPNAREPPHHRLGLVVLGLMD